MLGMGVVPGEHLMHDGLVGGNGDVVEFLGGGRILAACGGI